ncbi:hypothetical protein JTB14_036345 [Gonioctena quinquepunctata]|nr:hypothetical protein JTB14_036345 [Gonioctena quinquepunctata]
MTHCFSVGSDGDVTSGSEYFPSSDDEDPEESVSEQQIAYERDIEKVKRKVFSKKIDNFQKDIQENTSIAKNKRKEMEIIEAEKETLDISPSCKKKHYYKVSINVKHVKYSNVEYLE